MKRSGANCTKRARAAQHIPPKWRSPSPFPLTCWYLFPPGLPGSPLRSPSFSSQGSDSTERTRRSSRALPSASVLWRDLKSSEQAGTHGAPLDLLTSRILGDSLCRCTRLEGLGDAFLNFIKFIQTLLEEVGQPVPEPGCVLLISGLAHTVARGCACVPGARATICDSVILPFLWLSSTRGKHQSNFFRENVSLGEKSVPRSILYKV